MEVLKAGFFQKIPHSFLDVDIRGGRRLVGPYAQTIKHFAKYQNYSFQYEPLESQKMSDVQRSIERGVYNISMQAVAFKNSFANISFSYPVKWSMVCVMVPSQQQLPHYWYILWPFNCYVWILFWLMILYVAFLMCFLKHPSTKFSCNLLRSLAVLLHSPNMNLRVTNIAHKIQLFYSLLFLLGFILSNYYICYLNGYNLKPIFQPFPRTIEELLKRNEQVWIPTQILEEMRNNPDVDLTQIEPLFVEKSQTQVTQSIHQYSNKYAYAVTQSDWTFFTKLQRHLIQPFYKLSDICPLASLSTYPIAVDSKFAADLNFFILLIHQAGLWQFWEEEAFIAALHAKYFHILHDSYPVEPLTLHYYRIAWIILGAGNTMAALCTAMEVIVYKCLNKINQR